MAHAEGPPNWLSRIIEEKRRAIRRLIPFFEKKAQRDAILAVISAHPKGESLSSKANLPKVVWAALGLANQLEREAKKNPAMTASPAIQASWFIFEEFGMPLPEPEF